MNEAMTSTDKVMPRLTARGASTSRVDGMLIGWWGAGYQTPRVESMSGGVERLTTTVTGLRPNTKYQFKVQATNSHGVGPLSPATLLSGTQERHVGQFSCRFCGQCHNNRCQSHKNQWTCCGSIDAGSVYCQPKSKASSPTKSPKAWFRNKSSQ